VARVELVLRRRRLATAEALQQLLEALHVLGGDHVQQRNAFDVVEMLVAEHLQVGVVGADVHAFMHVGDGVARGGDQRIAAALGLAHLRLDAAQAATRLQVHPLVADHGEQMLGALAQGEGADAVAAGLHQLVLVDALGQQHQRMSLPLAAMCWAASCSGMPCEGEASTRSMAWLDSTWASSAASCGRHGRTAMPLLRRVLTMASAFSPLSSTISRRMVMSFAFCMHCSPICESRYTMRGEPSMRAPLRASNGDLVHTTPPAAWPLAQAHWKL
jgi:hypothetical protein